jgi:hypothetical protein
MPIKGHDAQTPNQPTTLRAATDALHSCSVVLIHSAWAGWYYEPCTHPKKPTES